MNLLLEAVSELADRTDISPGQPLASQLAAWTRQPGTDDIEPAIALRAVLIWSRLHGFVSLEIAGNFASMAARPRSAVRDPESDFREPHAGVMAESNNAIHANDSASVLHRRRLDWRPCASLPGRESRRSG